jgi:hypothetical protein
MTTHVLNIKDSLRLLCREWRKKNSYIDTDGRTIMPEYPKAMMSYRQISNGTATINCGNDTPENRAMAEEIILSEQFRRFLKIERVQSDGIEHAPGVVQIRLRYVVPERALPEV